MQRVARGSRKSSTSNSAYLTKSSTISEAFYPKDEAATIEVLQAPINRAIQREKFKQRVSPANHEVSLRAGIGGSGGFVETFLENR